MRAAAGVSVCRTAPAVKRVCLRRRTYARILPYDRQNIMADNIEEKWLISLVEERPVIWDRTIAEYKDKSRTFEAWREICATLNEDFTSMTNGEKILYGKSLTKKWNSLRDCWMKCHKRLLSKTTDEAKKVKKYFYYDQMKFLTKVVPSCGIPNDANITKNSFEETCDTSEDEESDYSNKQTSYKKKRVPTERSIVYYTNEEDDPIPTPNKKKKIEIEITQIKDYVSNEVDARLMKLINSIQEKEEISPIMSFFRGIEPTVAKFDETDLVEFQYEVMSVIRNIQQKNYSMK